MSATAGDRDKGSRVVLYAALVGNVLVAVTKFVAAAITGSAAMLSEAVHSLADTSNELLLLYGGYRARRLQPPGFLALNYGYRTPLTTIAAHALYGLVLGAQLTLT